jgi:glycosyltransferase involved in cell wall biosynthesis
MNESPLAAVEFPLVSVDFPLVSVVLGTYNGEAYLEEQLRSVLAQTYPVLEIIAIDDGSSDGTVAILRGWAIRDPRIRVVVNERNLGFIRNFEKGCSLAAGRYIALCDQDDYWFPEKVEQMVRAIGPYPMVYCDSELCGDDLRPLGRRISDLVHYQSFDDCRQLCVFSRMYGHATLITRELFAKASPFLEEVPHDGWLAYHATLYGGVRYLPEVLVKYRQHAGNVFGVVGRKKMVGRKKKKAAAEVRAEKQKKKLARVKELARIRVRMNAYCDACPEMLVPQKQLLRALVRSYQSFSPLNDLRRVWLFLVNCDLLLAVKNYSRLRKYLFCFKMLVKIK